MRDTKADQKGRERMIFDFSAIMIIFKGRVDGGRQWQQISDAALTNRITTEIKSAGLCFLPL